MFIIKFGGEIDDGNNEQEMFQAHSKVEENKEEEVLNNIGRACALHCMHWLKEKVIIL